MNKSTPLKNKKGKTGMYFTHQTEEWIGKYINETDSIKRDIIIRNHLYKPFKKLCEIYYNKINTPYLDRDNSQTDLQNDCFTHLITNSIYKFAGDRGKAFSYLSIAARNYFIQRNRMAQVRFKKKQNNHFSHDEEFIDYEFQRLEQNKEFIEKYYGFIVWAREHIPTLPFIKGVRDTMFDLLEFFDDFDEVQNYYKLEVSKILRMRYNVTENHLKSAKDRLHAMWVQYQKNWENEEEYKLPQFTSRNIGKHLSEEHIQYILSNYRAVTHKNGATALSIKLGVPRGMIWEVLKDNKKRLMDK